ncbi:uncharacterized protein [Dermacentor albipictus]|uniref:uncharacterized protein n=1 Tax=Dermacentor albipictus TaxID=60249 RepID=UPI0038FC3D5F
MEDQGADAGSKRRKSMLHKSQKQPSASAVAMRASILPEPEVRVISPRNEFCFDDGQLPTQRALSRWRSSSVGSLSEGSGGTKFGEMSSRLSSSVGSLSEGSGGVTRTSAGSVLEMHSSRHARKGPNVADGSATSPGLKGKVIAAPAQLMSLRRSTERSDSKRPSTASKTSSSSSSSSSSSKRKRTKHEGAKQEATAEAHAEKDATKPGTSSSLGKTEHNAAAGHTESRPSSYAARSKGLPEKDANAKTQDEKHHAKPRTSNFSEATRRASTASTTGPCALKAAVSAPQDQVRPAAPAPVAAKITGTTVEPASTKESHQSSSSTTMPGVTASKDHESSRPHKRRASSSRRFSLGRVSRSTASDRPDVAAVSHGQAPAHAPGEEEVISKAPSSALAPHSKPSDATIAASTTRSQNQPSCSVAAPAGIAVPAVSQEVVVPHTSRNGKAAEAAAYASAPSKIQGAAPPATSISEDDKMASRGKDVAVGGKAAVDQQTHQPPARRQETHPEPPKLAQTDRGGVGEQKRVVPKEGKADDTGISTGPSVETHEASPVDSQGKDPIGSTGRWSFYAMNVSFVTEVDERQQRLMQAVMICVCAVMLSLLVTAVLLMFYAKSGTSPLDCETAECLAARDYLTGLINASGDACGDFYGYVCDSWIARGEGGGSLRRDSVEASEARVSEFLRSRDKAEDVPADLRLARIVYRECQRYASASSDPAAFAATLESARSQLKWTEIRDSSSYDKLVELLVRTSLLVGFHTVLIIELFTEDSDAVLRLSSGTSLLHKLTTTGDRRDLVSSLRSVGKYDDRGLNTILKMDDLVKGPLDANRHSSRSAEEGDVNGPLEEFLGELVPGVNATAWAGKVQDVLVRFGEKGLFLSDIAIANEATGFRRAFREMTSNGGIQQTALYLASHLDAEILSLELSRRRLSLDPEDEERFCVALVQRTLPSLWPRFVASALQVRRTEDVVEAIFDQLKEASHDTAMLKWFTASLRQAAHKNIRTSINDGANRYAQVVDDLAEWNASFVELFVKVTAFVHGVRLRSPPTREELLVPLWERRGELAYSRSTTAVVVPTLYQQAPYLYPVSVPAHFNYATVGALLATAIAEVIAPVLLTANESRRDSDRHSGSWWTRGAMRQYRISAACLEQLHNHLGLQRRVSGGGGERQRHEMVLRAQGLRLAYDALVASYGRSAAGRDFRKQWPEAQAAFFARFCLLSCDADQSPSPLSPRASCLLPLHNMPEFGAAFGCASREDFVTQQCLF